LPESRGRSLSEVAVEAVDEVGNPTILATFAVIGAILPMAFVRGLMGPYMRPIPVGASAAMLFSLMVAFVVSPWAALRLLRKYVGSGDHSGHDTEGWTTRLYRPDDEPANPRRTPPLDVSWWCRVVAARRGYFCPVEVGSRKNAPLRQQE
jgi:hypothetical protein